MQHSGERKQEMVPWVVRSVVFDLDGLMVDTEPIFAEAAELLLKRRGLAPQPEVLRRMMGTPARQSVQLLCEHYPLTESVEALIAEGTQIFFELLGVEKAPLLSGVVELLDRLERKGVPKALATSSSLAYVTRILKPHELLARFDFVLTADDICQGKPHPEIYLKAVARFGHAPAEMVVLEDSPNGLRAAKAAGARCVVVPHGLIRLEDVTAADAIVPSLAAPRLGELLGV
jgi:HAD superfamily hydrolase (TIGR01509 family)